MTNLGLRLNKAICEPVLREVALRDHDIQIWTLGPRGGAGELEQSPLEIAKQTQIPKIYMQICTHMHLDCIPVYSCLYSSVHEIPFLYSLMYL